MVEHKNNTKKKIRDMTLMYRNMESQLQGQISEKEKKVAGQDEDKMRLKQEIETLKKETQDMITEKDLEIREQEKRIDEMSSDFAKMLKNTLAKMQDRIDFGI